MLRNIEAERTRKGWSKEALSKKLRVSLKTYYNWINESVDIPSSKLYAMANLFDVSMEYLLGLVKIQRSEEMDLSTVKTCELVAKLKTKEGVETIMAEPYQKKEVSVEGPAIILVVKD